MMPVYLVCGVPGSGKTWVCRQVCEKFAYVPHDLHINDHIEFVCTMAKQVKIPIITECPFAERVTKEKLEAGGCVVIPIFIVEKPEVVAERYLQREGKPLYQSGITRASSIGSRADEWGAFKGTAGEVLNYLKAI